MQFSNKKQIQSWIDEYGEDSDFVRVRVRGVFPRASTAQFIPRDLVDGGGGTDPLDHGEQLGPTETAALRPSGRSPNAAEVPSAAPTARNPADR